MTTITFFKSTDNRLTGYRASGHAGYGKHGQDILCSAISALTQAIGQGIKDVVNASAEMRCDDNSGFYEITVEDQQSAEVLEKVQILLRTLENALIAIANDRQYSGSIRINYSERR